MKIRINAKIISMKRTVVVLSGLTLVVLAGCWASFELLNFNQRSSNPAAVSSLNQRQQTSDDQKNAQPLEVTPTKTFTYTADLTKLRSQASMIYDLSLQRDVIVNRHQQPFAPASLTKIMTALIAIEKLTDLNQKLIVKSTTLSQMRYQQASLAGFHANELVSVRDLLYGTILASGGEASFTLAEAVAGNQTAFVKLMNQKAQTLGMKQTFFVNSDGLDSARQVTTASDMTKLLSFALQNPIFREIFTTQQYQTKSLNRQLTIKSTVFSKLASPDINGFRLLGAKSGTTGQAGLCLASLVKYGERELIIVTLHAPLVNWPKSLPYNIDDLKSILANLKLS